MLSMFSTIVTALNICAFVVCNVPFIKSISLLRLCDRNCILQSFKAIYLHYKHIYVVAKTAVSAGMIPSECFCITLLDQLFIGGRQKFDGALILFDGRFRFHFIVIVQYRIAQ